MFRAKSNIIEPNSEASASEYFAVADNITPIIPASVDSILNTEFTEEMQAVPEPQVKRLALQNKTTNPMSKFFNRLSTHLDALENFLTDVSKNYEAGIKQKKEIAESESTDQFLRTQKAKSTSRKLSKEQEENKRPTLNIEDESVQNFLAAALGLATGGVRSAIDSITNGGASAYSGKIFDETVREGDFTIGSGSNVSVAPKWIPFPKGTTGLTFTSGFGRRSSPGGIGSTNHKGIDIAGPVGTPIITPISGIVDFAGDAGSYGNLVVIKDGDTEMEFGHLNGISVKNIAEVTAGQVIGTLGSSGASTGPHLHWTIKISGAAVDPVQWTRTNDPLTSTSGFKADGSDEPLDTESEGGINYQRIMVGEAGAEFVIPMSQMPIFAHLMMEEKIKSLIPQYFTPAGRFDDIGFERKSGFSNTAMSEGGISGAIKFIKKHEGLAAFTPGTGGGNRQADYIGDGMSYSIKGTPRSKAYNPSTKLFSYIDTEGVPTIGYGTTFYDDIFGGDYPVRDGDTSNVGKMESIMNKHAKQIYDQYDEWYPLFKYFKPKQQAGIMSYLYNRGPNAIVGYNPMRRAMNAGNVHDLAHEIEIDIESVGPKRRKEEADLVRSGPSKIVGPKIVGPKEVGPGKVGSGLPLLPDLTIDKFFNPGKYGDQSSLNTISGNEQMEVANSYGDQFSLDNSKGEIIALYKPTVYYSDPA